MQKVDDYTVAIPVQQTLDIRLLVRRKALLQAELVNVNNLIAQAAVVGVVPPAPPVALPAVK